MDRDENVEIETLHATIRRLLKYYSLQTHKRKFKQMNADWTLRRMRKYSREPAKAANLPKPHTHKRHKPTHTEKKANAKATSKAKAASHSRYAQAGRAKPRTARKGTISMWNAWQSKYGGDDKGNFHKLNPKYREWKSNASPEDIAALREEAKGATHSLRHGMRAPLGGKARDKAREWARRSARAAAVAGAAAAVNQPSTQDGGSASAGEAGAPQDQFAHALALIEVPRAGAVSRAGVLVKSDSEERWTRGGGRLGR